MVHFKKCPTPASPGEMTPLVFSGFAKIFSRRGAIARRKRDLSGMPKYSGVTNSDREGSFDMLACFCPTAVHMQCPGICILRENVVPPGEFLLGDLQGFGSVVCVIGV